MYRCPDYSCPYMGCSGYCKLTACVKPVDFTRIVINERVEFNKTDAIVFPQTIGNITFYSSKELIKWVENQQKINKDSNYGIGNWA